MKKIIMFLSAIALFVACDKSGGADPMPNTFSVTKVDGTASNIPNVSLTYYEGDDALVVNNFAFMSGMLVSGQLPIIGGDASNEGGNIAISNIDDLDAIYQIGGQGAKGAISGLDCSISNNRAEMEFVISAAAMGGPGATTNYTCKYKGDVAVKSGNYVGMYMTKTGGTPSLLSGVEVSYYEGDNTLVITEFAYSAGTQNSMSETLVIPSITETAGTSMSGAPANYFSISGNSITPASNTIVTGTIDNLSGGIIYDKWAEFSFTTDVTSQYGSSTYTCSYVGDITVNEGSYSQD